MNDIADPEQPSPLFKLIGRASGGAQPGREVKIGSEDKKRVSDEGELLLVNPELARSALRALFPDGVPSDARFFDRLKDLQRRLGWGEVSHRITGIMLATAVKQAGNAAAESLLRQFPSIGSPDFFQMLDSLSMLAERCPLRAEFAAEWFPALVRRIGEDLASGGFWKGLEVYCENHPDSAVAMLRCLLSAKDEAEISVASFALGTLRTLPLPETLAAELEQLAESFLASSIAMTRSIHHRSWIHVARRGKMTVADLADVLGRTTAGTPEEQESAFWIGCRSILSPTVSPDCLTYGLEWLHANAKPTLSPVAKHHVVDLAANLAEKGQWEGEELVLAVQPIAVEQKGTWQRLEAFLVCRLSTDVKAFSEFALKLAQRSQRGWLKIMQEPRCYEWLLSEMQGKDLGLMVGQLVLSRDAGCRKLGHLLFDKLGLNAVPPQLMELAGEEGLRLALHELQRTMVHGDAIGRCLVSLIPCSHHASPELQEELYEELLLQAKNFAGSCRGEFERKANDYPLLKKVLDEAERYFGSLSQVRQSQLGSMEVTGYRHAARLYGRRFTNEVSKGSESMSVFMQFFKKTQLLYGKQWSSFQGGKLTEKSELQQFSSSVEIPRLEEIDPEGMALRRLNASAQLVTLSVNSEAVEAVQ